MFRAPDDWAAPLTAAGAERCPRPDTVDHLLVPYPTLATALEVAQARCERRGSTWALVAPTPEGAAAAAVLRAAGVEGQQRVFCTVVPPWPPAEAVRAWMGTHPRWGEGLGTRASRFTVDPGPDDGPGVTLVGGRGPLGRSLEGGAGPIARVIDAPDLPLARCQLADLDMSPLHTALDADAPLVVGVDHLTQRPGSLPSAVLSAAACVALQGSQRPWLQVGPVGAGPRTLGIAGLDPEHVRHQVLRGAGEIWLDVDWKEALAAFPHMAELASHLVDHPVLRRGRATREVCTVAASILGRAVPPDRPLAELGLDSLGAETLRQRLVERHGVPLPLTLVLEYPSAEAIGTLLAEGARRTDR